MDEEAEEDNQVKDGKVALLLNANDPWWEEGTVAEGGAFVPWDEAELEEVLHQHHSLEHTHTGDL